MKILGFSRRLTFALAATTMLGVGCGGSQNDVQPQPEMTEEEQINADIENLTGKQAASWFAVAAALAKYKDVNVATAAGYIPVSACEQLAGSGAMGIHYLNPDLASDLTNDPYKPEVLLYAPNSKGGLDLTGVEYFQADAGQARPTVYSEPFNGPMPGHNPQMPVHYDLHVWLYRYNSSGLFAQWNPNVKCP